jgi:hypothetical protein
MDVGMAQIVDRSPRSGSQGERGRADAIPVIRG